MTESWTELFAEREVLSKRVEDLEKERDEEIARNRPLRNLITSLEGQVQHWRKKGIEESEAVNTLMSEREANAILTNDLAAAQAREAQLREALSAIAWQDDHIGAIARTALALPSDHSALDERLKELIEKSITIIQNDSWAMTFQSVGQYRTALINEIKSLK